MAPKLALPRVSRTTASTRSFTRARLSVLTSLITHPLGLIFGELKQLCGLTDGNLSRHLQVLSRQCFKGENRYRFSGQPVGLARTGNCDCTKGVQTVAAEGETIIRTLLESLPTAYPPSPRAVSAKRLGGVFTRRQSA